ncbi:DUF4012 domain-containing protein [Knoellia sp. p5-6-4]|uniref:DUF4012 domain-containing protein n=1 Tax=unclassified Knoellia TaxID=2618719 RepID=UPI0023DBDF18|nr:DUF4012 domain-containing protein [Knoellia sp. p5-6-4]MDF2145851.1 DUF4012 domain-containing protein [Knoellia sp. p5-6-4]
MQGRRRRIRLSAYAVAAALLLYALALGWTAFKANAHLREARAAVGPLRSALVDQRTPAAEIDRRLRTLQHEADAARSLTGGPLWGLPAALPRVGDAFETVRGASVAVSRVAHEVLPPVSRARNGLVGVSLEDPRGGIDLAPIKAAQQPLGEAERAAEAVRADVRALPASGIGTVDAARRDLVTQLDEVAAQLSSSHDLVSLLPPMLGSQGPRRYLVAFQNDAEARGAGGLPGVYAVVRADRGRLDFVRYGVSGDFAGVDVPLDGLGEDYAKLYRGAAPGRFFGNATVSPHFPSGATLLLRFHEARYHDRLDGAVAIDPTALSMLLAVTGPTTLEDGTRVGAANVVALTERDAYERFPDPVLRKLYLIEVAKAVADDILERGPRKGTTFASALGKAVEARRLLVFSTHDSEQAVLASRKVGGALSDTDGLFSGVVINNGGGNKLDYYLEREVTYQAASCSSSTPHQATVTVRLTNTAPKSGLSDYVAGRADQPVVPVKKGTNRLLVSYYATKGAGFTQATLDGEPALLASDTERGRPVFTSTLDIGPGQSRVLRLTIEEPPQAKGPVTTLVQPLVRPQKTVVDAAGCPAS